MNKTNIIIEKLKNIQKELELENDNDNIIIINHINDTIDNIENSINDKNNYNKNKIKENIILKIFMPYIIYLTFIIKDEDTEQLLNVDNSFNESFFKEVLKKYIK